MFKSINKPFVSAIITAQLILLGSLYTGQAEAARRCSIRTLVEDSARSESTASRSRFSINEIEGVDRISLKAATITKVKKIFEKKDWDLGSRKKIKDIIEAAASNVKGNSREASIERANKMAEVGREILKAIKSDLKKDQVMLVTYMIAESVMRLEAVKTTEYKAGPELPVFKKKSTIHINKIHDLVESYVDGTAGYRDLPQDGGFLSWPEIRGLYTNNSWSIGLRDHDMYHMHYSYAHPYYLAVNFQSSRSINDRRYIYISALWESVDTFRTGLESNIANYYKRKNMSAEEGMLELGSATEKELDAIERVVGAPDSVGSFNELSYAQGWRPTKTKFARRSTTVSEEVLLKELSDFINESKARMAVRSNSRYGNYHRLGPGNTVGRDQNTIPGYD